MVTTRVGRHAQINRDLLTRAIKIFGKTLIIRRSTRTVDNFGQLSSISTADTSFKGDLQFGIDVDQKLIEVGFIEVGEGILYIHPLALAILPTEQDIIVDGSAEWEIIEEIQSPELEGATTHHNYRCRRRINSGD